MVHELIRFFDEPVEPGAEVGIETLGGKCASLVSMTAAGMPVPPGFAVTTHAFEAFLVANGLRDEIVTRLGNLDPEDLSAVDAVSAGIRDHIRSFPTPPEVHDALAVAHARLQSRFEVEVPVAVRSSATAEDLPGASFAGQQDTYLWLTGLESVARHIRECWASLYTSRAILYRLRNQIPDEGLSMAVAVQKMVDSAASGVAITMNPATGDRSKITIDASYGVGELVVSGQVTPDNIVLDKVMLTVVGETLGAKHAELVPDRTLGRLVEREVDEERRGRRCLSDAEVVAVAAMAKRAERHYGCPQDVEWAFDRDLPAGENLLLLQARPETVHSSTAPPAPSGTPTATSLTGLMSGLSGALRRGA